jgi:FkbM family methyltransferase
VGFKAVSMGVRLPELRIEHYFESVHLKALLASLEIDCVLDVGANEGQFCSGLRSIGYEGRIVSFEPVPQAFAALSALMEGDALWTGHRIALGAERRTATIHVPDETSGSSFLKPLEDLHLESQEVAIERLDAVLPTLDTGVKAPRLFLKMDTQGFDLEVFKGASGCLDSILGLQSEISVVPLYEGMPDYLEALTTYEEAGFSLHNLSLVGRTSTGRILELNCYMERL